MTQLIGRITNSTGTLLNGVFSAQLQAFNSTDTTTPDTLYTLNPGTFPVTAGALSAEIPSTEELQIAYKFSFVETGKTEPLFAINAIMPNAGPVNLPTLFPSGITNRNLDTGALRVAKVLGADPELSQLIKQPATFSVVADNLSAATPKTWYLPKPFTGAILTKTLTVLGLSGYDNWSFVAGVVNSAGNEADFTGGTTATTNGNGRRRILKTYNETRAASVMGLYIKAAPLAGAANLNATLSVSYLEIN
ncbi:MAG: hypothetical protein U5M23_00345 [Marinagarivorans sp.]|nr:hypothetical protein [Marinagarivorans sp.]